MFVSTLCWSCAGRWGIFQENSFQREPIVNSIQREMCCFEVTLGLRFLLCCVQFVLVLSFAWLTGFCAKRKQRIQFPLWARTCACQGVFQLLHQRLRRDLVLWFLPCVKKLVMKHPQPVRCCVKQLSAKISDVEKYKMSTWTLLQRRWNQ